MTGEMMHAIADAIADEYFSHTKRHLNHEAALGMAIVAIDTYEKPLASKGWECPACGAGGWGCSDVDHCPTLERRNRPRKVRMS
jgi:hypothetical protein